MLTFSGEIKNITKLKESSFLLYFQYQVFFIFLLISSILYYHLDDETLKLSMHVEVILSYRLIACLDPRFCG